MTSRRVGIKEVAAAAGVSITTVSHALNGKGRLTPETRQRVRDVATALDYQPSALARGLAGGRTGMLALAVSFVDDFSLPVADFDYFLQVMNAATSTALELGYSLTLLPTDARSTRLDRLPLDGAVVMDPVRADPIVQPLTGRGVHVVTTGRMPGGPDSACWVDNDHIAGTRAMLEHLEEEGAQRIALLTAPITSSYTIDALEAYEVWSAEHDMEPIVATIGETSEGGAFAAASELLESRDPPDAIYATLDRLALGVLLAAEGKGVRVPEDLRIAGCTDSEASRAARPALTALSLNPERLGREAIELLIELIEHGVPEDPHRIVPSLVIPRGSTSVAAPRQGDLPAPQ
jgi:DNA-binding LacI/PurR family transcriptional regulator